MLSDPPTDAKALVETLCGGEPTPTDGLFAATYDDLRRIAQALMNHEAPGHTFQATSLVNEAYLKLVGGREADWRNQRHFINTVARAMRQVLIDRARRKLTSKRGAGRTRLDDSNLDAGVAETFPLDRAAELEAAVADLEAAEPRWGEIVHLRFFAGLTVEQTAELMGISAALVKKDWKFARAWLSRALREPQAVD